MQTLFTIGHSNRELIEFIDLLQTHGIERIVDVRKMPRSRTHPQFNGPELARDLEALGISYAHLESLTGFRRGAKLVTDNAWENKSFQAYAAYMETMDFIEGIDTLISMGTEKVTAVMCSEAVWWRCHRRMIADGLLARGWEVRHILSKSAPSLHELTKMAKVEAGRVTYPKDPNAPPVTAPRKPTRGAPHKQKNQPSAAL
jgi:uncharacterized protein (DUF488 family)